MKKAFLLMASVVAGMILFSCGGGKTEVSPEQLKLDSAEFTVEGLQKMVTSPEIVTPVEYRALVLAYSKVGINKATLDLDANPVDEAIRGIFKVKERPQTEKAILRGLLKSPYPQVRAYAITKLPSSENDTVMDVLEQEKDPFVIKEGLSALRFQTRRDRVAAFFVACSKDSHKKIREQCAFGLGRKDSKDKPGVKEAVLELLKDTDVDVKRVMCRNCGNLYDESLVPELVKILDDSAQADVHADCVESLYTLWYDFPFHKSTSKVAYDATIAYFKKTPRTEDIPAWQSISKLRSQNDIHIDSWKARATYFDPKEYVAVMKKLAVDHMMSWLGRNAAVNVIAKWGTKADLQEIENTISANADDSKARLVIQEIDKELKK